MRPAPGRAPPRPGRNGSKGAVGSSLVLLARLAPLRLARAPRPVVWLDVLCLLRLRVLRFCFPVLPIAGARVAFESDAYAFAIDCAEYESHRSERKHPLGNPACRQRESPFVAAAVGSRMQRRGGERRPGLWARGTKSAIAVVTERRDLRFEPAEGAELDAGSTRTSPVTQTPGVRRYHHPDPARPPGLQMATRSAAEAGFRRS